MSGFEAPNWTQIPNYILDEWMSKLSHAEFKILMLIFRYTTGFHRRQAQISIRHFVDKCGVTNQWVQDSIKKFETLGWIKVHRGNHMTPNTYEILIRKDSISKNDCCTSESYTPVLVTSTPCTTESYTINKEKEKDKEIIIRSDAEPPPPDPIDDDFSSPEKIDAPICEGTPVSALYPCLDKLDLDTKFKRDIPKMKTADGKPITADLIEKAVNICLARRDEIKTLEAYFTRIIQCPDSFPEISTKCEKVEENIEIARKYLSRIQDKALTYDIGPEYVEIGKYPSFDYIKYEENNFENKLMKILRKRKVNIDERYV